MLCLPWWHSLFAGIGGDNRQIVRSGCRTVDGNVRCQPEAMRAAAERKAGRPISLATYTLARYMSSEVGSGTPEEKVAVAEAAVNRGRGDVVALLLYRQATGHPNRGWYGPIHGPSGVSTAPYGRWAATSKDPGLDDLAIADFVLSGNSDNFARGARSQLGMEYLSSPNYTVKKLAGRRDYWVGPLPGVDHWRTFLYARHSGIAPEGAAGQELLQRGLAAVASPTRPDWSGLAICAKSRSGTGAAIVVVGALGVLGYLVYRDWRASPS